MDAAPGFLAQGEDEAVDEAHGRDADDGRETQPVDGVVGVVVGVVHAVLGEGDDPHACVDDRVDEHEAELPLDADALVAHVSC